MKWKERKQRHDDTHHPMQGTGKRAARPKFRIPAGPLRRCFYCNAEGPLGNDHQCDEINYERGSHWREFTLTNSTEILDSKAKQGGGE